MLVVMKKKIPDAAFLMECVDYDPKTGMFRWLHVKTLKRLTDFTQITGGKNDCDIAVA